MEPNARIRNACREFNVKLWQVADKLNISDTTFSKKLRKQLSEAETKEIIFIIKSIKRNRDEF